MRVPVYRIDGTETGRSVELPESIFGVPVHEHAIYLDVKAYLANQRQGTHKTKKRGEVRGGGRKPWRQKGTGRARQGSIRAPHWVGGGRVFGPVPRDYRQELNRKVKRLARLSALSQKAQAGAIRVVEDFDFEAPKTKRLLEVLRNLGLAEQRVLLLTPGVQPNVYKSGRNLERVQVLEAQKVTTYEVLRAQVLLFEESAVRRLSESLTRAQARLAEESA
ncbi:MAG: 50S ribosomal protein L4 [Bacteroidetes bacterium]|nr:50S ribosomal protein L4 [Rhodothermia bacterium]MCS7154545.1 50S ribosomal protein L4 [Bacteroidota bacterium]MCX7906262.1 50S ribosomal protein L4 [Bacteroidota bacterium]MDW8137338.1 50S ribosomal protein L4 [Bacteroidota bacterium]MDW8285708.1 50S ribosomal protein L4 [Bacteroidota bacterium]